MGKPPEGGASLLTTTSCLFALCFALGSFASAQIVQEHGCPAQENILPCRCSTRGMEFQIWCSHSELPSVLEGLKAVSHYVTRPVDELILENNNLPSLPGKVFTSLRVLRLMLRNNRLERVSSSWLEGLHDSLLELFIVEPDLRSLPIDSLENLGGLEAITLQSRSMKRLPRFSGLTKLRYLQVNSPSLVELSPLNFRSLPSLEQLHVFGSPRLARLEAGLLRNLPRLALLNVSETALAWIHPRALIDLPELREIGFTGNEIADASVVGRAIVDLPNLSSLNLNGNRISRLTESSFVDNPALNRLTIAHNFITEISAGAFQRLANLRVLDLSHNRLRHVSPEFFLQRVSGPSAASLEEIWLIGNEIRRFTELRAILEALPGLKFLDLSHNLLEEIPYGALRGHSSLERLHLDHNRLSFLQRDSFAGMPALRELRLRNNSLNNLLETPFWNLPGLKGLDLSENYFRRVEPRLLGNLPNLRRLDLSGNGIGSIEVESFVRSPALEHVNVSRNALSTIHPMTFRHLSSLYELDLGWNRLLEIVPGLPRNIEHLHLPMNRIVALPSPGTRDLALPSLRSLDLSANGIERILPGTLAHLTNLKRLDLGYNSLAVVDDRTFDGLARLEFLDLRFNRIVSLHGRSLEPLTNLAELNLRGNRLEIIRPDLFQDNSRLEKLDFSRNRLAQIPHATFSTTRELRELFASHNSLTELPVSLHGLKALQVLDLSFNKLNILSPDTLSSLTSLLELRLVRNRIKELREGAFERLPRLTFIDLENNDLRFIEKNAIRSLPELQSLRLGKNRLTNIPAGAFTELPLLQSAELQENRIHEIAANAFINVPHLLFLNLSHNELPGIGYVGLESLTSLEVLDLSNNRISRISTESLASMEWLVELKMDNNKICSIEGSPFDDMPRLRVLSLRGNRLSSVAEKAFKRLRSNIAVLDIDGNPLSCSCSMLWLRGWLQQGSSDGPRCADGSLFKEIRLSRQDCQRSRETEPIHPGCEAETMAPSPSKLYEAGISGDSSASWMNFRDPPEDHASPESLDYLIYNDFNEDQRPVNGSEAAGSSHQEPATASAPLATNHVTPPPQSPAESVSPPIRVAASTGAGQKSQPSRNKNSSVLPSPSSSGFTFFGVPLPSINFNLWGNSGSRKAHRKEDSSHEQRPGRERYRVYPPTEPEIHRGGFFPLPQSQGGFVPIPDPRLTHDLGPPPRANGTRVFPGLGNRTAAAATAAATVTRVYQVPGGARKNQKVPGNPDLRESRLPTLGKTQHGKEREELTTPRSPTGLDRQRGVRPNSTKNRESTGYRVTEDLQNPEEKTTLPIRVDKSSTATSVVTSSPQPTATSAPPRTFLPTVTSSEVSSLPTSTSSQLYEREIQLVASDDDRSSAEQTVRTSSNSSEMPGQVPPKKITKIGVWDVESRLPPGKHISAEESDDSSDPADGRSTTLREFNVNKSTLATTSENGGSEILEASALSALLVPGGQISTSISSKPPSGRSTIIKVASPHLKLTAERDLAGNGIPTNSTPANPTHQSNAVENPAPKFEGNSVTVVEENPFNWYFQNYNESNIEPYVAVVYSGENNVLVSTFLITVFPLFLVSRIIQE
ncbi:protein artichoke isoform X2 [Venturia canescens]|uniref:protein artichoke isoform X2 n=1 Tax=Venturia canescens TaxID=32260 RepID=UPI001C9CA426|nr:protein artichoke isoform X2 [Venturia canescens]